MSRPKPPSSLSIAKYWDGHMLFKGSNDRTWNPMIDIGEPSCQACGCYHHSWDEYPFEERWDITGLEKAHIVPHSLGGPSVPENFLMLCTFCHHDFDREICIENMDEFETVVDWLIQRPTNKSNLIKNLFDEFIENRHLDAEIFWEAIRKTAPHFVTKEAHSYEVWFKTLLMNSLAAYSILKDREFANDI